MSIDPSPLLSAGVNALEVDRSLAQLQELSNKLLAERDLLSQRLRNLEGENLELRSSLAALKEKWEDYRPIIQKWGRELMSPEEAEEIMKANDWISLDEFRHEVQQIIERP